MNSSWAILLQSPGFLLPEQSKGNSTSLCFCFLGIKILSIPGLCSAWLLAVQNTLGGVLEPRCLLLMLRQNAPTPGRFLSSGRENGQLSVQDTLGGVPRCLLLMLRQSAPARDRSQSSEFLWWHGWYCGYLVVVSRLCAPATLVLLRLEGACAPTQTGFSAFLKNEFLMIPKVFFFFLNTWTYSLYL